MELTYDIPSPFVPLLERQLTAFVTFLNGLIPVTSIPDLPPFPPLPTGTTQWYAIPKTGLAHDIMLRDGNAYMLGTSGKWHRMDLVVYTDNIQYIIAG